MVQHSQSPDISDKWDILQVSYAEPSQEELDERQEASAEVTDPLFLMRQEVDADGEMDVDVEGAAVEV